MSDIDLAPDRNPWSEWLKNERAATGGGVRLPDGGESWVPQTAVFDDSPSGQINRQNPYAMPDKPFVQAGQTGGYLDGTGITIGQGRSITPAQELANFSAAESAGISSDWLKDFYRRNTGDSNRFLEAYNSERVDTSENGSDPRSALSGGPFGSGQRWSGNWFDDPANSQLETLIKNQLNGLSNPGANSPQAELQNFLMQRFRELAGSNGYSPQELSMLHTQGLEPIEALRSAAQKREVERTAARGFLPTSGLTRMNQQQNDTDYDRMRAAASRDLAIQNINERSNRLNQAVQLGQGALGTERGTNALQLQLSTLLQQLPRQSMLDALNVYNASGTPDSLASIVNQIAASQNQQRLLGQQQAFGNASAIGSLIAELFG